MYLAFLDEMAYFGVILALTLMSVLLVTTVTLLGNGRLLFVCCLSALCVVVCLKIEHQSKKQQTGPLKGRVICGYHCGESPNDELDRSTSTGSQSSPSRSKPSLSPYEVDIANSDREKRAQPESEMQRLDQQPHSSSQRSLGKSSQVSRPPRSPKRSTPTPVLVDDETNEQAVDESYVADGDSANQEA